MIIDDSLLQCSEKITLSLRSLFRASGFAPYRMSKFEEYDLYASNKDFLVSDNVITFTDTDGKLMALKPDVTLSIIKNTPDEPELTKKVFYSENIYRVSGGTGTFREIMQTGAEVFGNVSEEDTAELLRLAAKSLELISTESVIALSDLDILSEFIGALGISKSKQTELYKAVFEKSVHRFAEICGNGAAAAGLTKLLSINDDAAKALQQLEELCPDSPSFIRLKKVMGMLGEDAGRFKIDFSVSADTHYYNGIIFKGFVKNVPTYVLSGGQYDRLMEKLGKKSRAIGFAVYTDELERLEKSTDPKISADEWLNIALPKGRLGEKVYAAFEKAGFECPSVLNPERKLVLENPDKKIRYFWVKPSDVAIYVERGAADVGVCGKDILLENSPDVFELLDLKTGRCRMAVAAPKGFKDPGNGTLRVATKFEEIAKDHYRSKGRAIDLIHLNGSIELAPILGLSDVIVDIVETGTTLKENNLEVIETIVDISARLISNKSSARFKQETVENLINALKSALSQEDRQ